jgi:cytidylate kinase
MTKQIITISRAFGSGGHTIGQEVAKRLGIPFYDKELVDEVAKQSGFHADFIKEAGEYAPVSSSFLFSIAVSPNPLSTMHTMSMADQLFVYQTNVIRNLAEKGPCVIVGRCADYILREREDALHVFIHADMAYRAERIVRLYGETKQTPDKRLAEKDNKRKVYYKHYTNRNWGDAQNYHLCLNSGLIGIDKCTDIIVDVAQMYE